LSLKSNRETETVLKILKTETMETRNFKTAALALFAVLMLCGSTSAKGKEFRSASSLENAIDPVMKIEDWMVYDFVWSKNAVSVLAEESDETIGIESWMTNSFFWEKFENAEDANLTLESWMFDESNWTPAGSAIETELEKGLKLEAWMTDNNNWK
jgi:hypothetical protein